MTINNGPGYTIIIDNHALDEMLRGPNGYVVKYLIKQAEKVQAAAKNQCGYDAAGGGDHGHLRDSIVKRVMASPGGGDPNVQVGSSHPIALIHHEGTKPHMILPTSASVLAFPADWGDVNGIAFAAQVNHPGTAPNRYLTDNLRLVR
jgi:hypothetical protein